MLHDHVLKKLNFDRQVVGGGGGGEGKICGSMLLHFVIPFNLICIMTRL